MERRIFMILAIMAVTAVFGTATAQRLSDDEVQKGLTDLRNYKHRILVQELKIDKDKQQKFFDVYDAMDDELMVVAAETRELERKVLSADKASDTELDALSRSLFEQKKREGEIEMRYYERLHEVLTPRQLASLKSAERKISMTLAKYHGRQRRHQR